MYLQCRFCTHNYKGRKVKDEKQSWGTFPPSVSWLRSQGKVSARSYVSPSHSPRHLKALKLGAILEASSPKIVVQASNWVVSGWTEHETWHEMAASKPKDTHSQHSERFSMSISST